MASCKDNLESLADLLLYFIIERGDQVKFEMHVDEKSEGGPHFEAVLIEWGWRYHRKLGRKPKPGEKGHQKTLAAEWATTPNKAIEKLVQHFRM
jgi:hypothetical protein